MALDVTFSLDFWVWLNDDGTQMERSMTLTAVDVYVTMNATITNWTMLLEIQDAQIDKVEAVSYIGGDPRSGIIKYLLKWALDIAVPFVNKALTGLSDFLIEKVPEKYQKVVALGQVDIFGQSDVLYVNANPLIATEPYPVVTRDIGLVDPWLMLLFLVLSVLIIGSLAHCLRQITVDIDQFRADFNELKKEQQEKLGDNFSEAQFIQKYRLSIKSYGNLYNQSGNDGYLSPSEDK